MAGERLFAVVRTRGAAWDASRPLERQDDWKGRAAFMNGFADEGLVMLGGPLEGTPDVLLVVRARSRDEVAARLAADPWAHSDLLRVSRIAPWDVRLGAMP